MSSAFLETLLPRYWSAHLILEDYYPRGCVPSLSEHCSESYGNRISHIVFAQMCRGQRKEYRMDVSERLCSATAARATYCPRQRKAILSMLQYIESGEDKKQGKTRMAPTNRAFAMT